MRLVPPPSPAVLPRHGTHRSPRTKSLKTSHARRALDELYERSNSHSLHARRGRIGAQRYDKLMTSHHIHGHLIGLTRHISLRYVVRWSSIRAAGGGGGECGAGTMRCGPEANESAHAHTGRTPSRAHASHTCDCAWTSPGRASQQGRVSDVSVISPSATPWTS